MRRPFLWICRARKLRTAPVQALRVTPGTAALTPKVTAVCFSALPPPLAAPQHWGANRRTPVHDKPNPQASLCQSREQLAGTCPRNTTYRGRERLSTAAASHQATECSWMFCSSTESICLYLNVSPYFHVQAHGFIKLSYSS